MSPPRPSRWHRPASNREVERSPRSRRIWSWLVGQPPLLTGAASYSHCVDGVVVSFDCEGRCYTRPEVTSCAAHSATTAPTCSSAEAVSTPFLETSRQEISTDSGSSPSSSRDGSLISVNESLKHGAGVRCVTLEHHSAYESHCSDSPCGTPNVYSTPRIVSRYVKLRKR